MVECNALIRVRLQKIMRVSPKKFIADKEVSELLWRNVSHANNLAELSSDFIGFIFGEPGADGG
jgi:hypothetical protein